MLTAKSSEHILSITMARQGPPGKKPKSWKGANRTKGVFFRRVSRKHVRLGKHACHSSGMRGEPSEAKFSRQRLYAMRSEQLANEAMHANAEAHMKLSAINAARGYMCCGSKEDIARVARLYGLELMDIAEAAARAVKTCIGIGELRQAAALVGIYGLAARPKAAILEDELLELYGGNEAQVERMLTCLKNLSKKAGAAKTQSHGIASRPHKG